MREIMKEKCLLHCDQRQTRLLEMFIQKPKILRKDIAKSWERWWFSEFKDLQFSTFNAKSGGVPLSVKIKETLKSLISIEKIY
jgi:hypothetical protein